MHFTRLRLHGFKSFVDPTEMVIAPGLTGVVGPNGCGKSNLLEAIRWVMGETSAKAMRGGGMEDVIFAGAATRPARAFAEVALHLDNRHRRAPPAFNEHDALEVARRIVREAGSAYRVNGREARARDIRMLFADAATGASSPALVRQGRISELVNAKPQARRAILEEAAGVSGLHQRRHEALLKLDAAGRNLERVDEVLADLDQRLGQLRRQAKQAGRYRVIADALRRAELALVVRRWRETASARLSAETALAEAAKAVAAAQGEASRAARARAEAEEALPPLREEAGVAAAILQRLAIERDQIAARAEAAAKALEAARDRVRQLDADSVREEQLNADAAESLSRLDAEIAEIERSRPARAEAARAAEAAAREAEAAVGAREAAFDAANAEAVTLSAAVEAAGRRLQETRRVEAKAVEAEAAARRAAQAAAAQAAELEGRLDALREAAEAAEAESAGTQAAAEEAETALADAEAARAGAESAEGDARAAAAAAQGEAKALAAEAAGLEKLLARGRDAAGDPILEQIRAAPGFEAALGAALGDDLALPEAAGDATGWRALDALTPEAPPDGAEPLAPQVSAPPALARRLARVAVVARDRGEALMAALAPGWRLVSREGDLWRWDGLHRRAGDAPNAAAERLALKNRLDALRAALAEAEAKAEAASDAHAAARAALGRAAEAESGARAARRIAESRAADAARGAARARSELEAAEGRLATLAETRDARGEDLESAAETLAEAQAARAEAEAAQAGAGDPEAAKAVAAEARRAMEAARAAAREARAAAEEAARRESGRERRLAAALKEREGWAGRLGAAETRAAELERRLAAARRERAAAEEAPAAVEADRERLARTLRDAEARRSKADDALAAAEAALRAASAAARDSDAAASAAREEKARREARLESEAARAGEAEAALLDAEPRGAEAAIAALGEAEDLPDAAAAEAEIAKLRRQRDALGPVNLRAEADAEEVETERDALAKEKAELEEAIAKLRRGVAELNREGRERLLNAFDRVDETFRSLFTHLFGGGDAKLALVESDDPLEAGLEIMAMPPGKKLAALSLLSGGEQTLTALALIFAVFLTNPAPICVLDEVDAPLDDANVGRFCDLLDEMTRRTETRFLIITHHALTMSRMDRLFGVTMAEQGVSQLVSVDLAAAAEMVAG